MNETLLSEHFGERLQRDIPLAKFTTARVGGPARFLVSSTNAAQLADDVQFLWTNEFPCFILGNGSNLLISDAGLDAVVVHNLARAITLEDVAGHLAIYAECGATLASIARFAAQQSLTGLEWLSAVPGTLGGAVYGNAGAHGDDIASCLMVAEVLHRTKGRLALSSLDIDFTYRSSILKRDPGNAVILSARLAVKKGSREDIDARMKEFTERRRQTQPAGSSTGSTFKNPKGDYAGRLIEAAGLKGTRIGGVEISQVHANFFVNDGSGTAQDYRDLILLVQKIVQEKFDVALETEIEIIGDWQEC